MNIKKEYSRIIISEKKIAKHTWRLPTTDYIDGICTRIGEVAQSSLVLRSYNNLYGLTKEKIAYESVGAHTNLMIALVMEFLRYYPTIEIYLANKGITLHTIIDAIQFHDLPENMIGDIPDNGSGNEEDKQVSEGIYYHVLQQSYPNSESKYIKRVLLLLKEMVKKNSDIGKILYCADKASAIMITLQEDANDTPPTLRKNGRKTSKRDREEMKICDKEINGRYFASEMWTIDWFKARKLIDYDITGFFTSLIVMRTLQINECWYDWREEDYN